mgnify:FL=1
MPRARSLQGSVLQLPNPPGIRAVIDEVARLGGVVRTPRLIELGHSRRRIDAAVSGGLLVRVRRGWVASVGADRELVAAARVGVVLTCVTEARRRGLWILREERLHVAAPPHGAGGKPPSVHLHWSIPAVPRHLDLLADPIENVLTTIAACRPRDDALVVWESALRGGLVTLESLAMLPLGRQGRELLAVASSVSDSGLETLFLVRLKWLHVRIIPQPWLLGHHADFLIGARLVVQIDGGHHIGPQRRSDNAHDAALLLAGYHVIRVDYQQVVHDWPAVQDLIVRAIARGLHLAR